jgi:hypothetical protein
MVKTDRKLLEVVRTDRELDSPRRPMLLARAVGMVGASRWAFGEDLGGGAGQAAVER